MQVEDQIDFARPQRPQQPPSLTAGGFSCPEPRHDRDPGLMATLSLRFEIEAVQDAIDDLERAHLALTRRHGAKYRRLERDIEESVDGLLTGAPIVHDLGDGFMMMTCPPEAEAVLRRARRLGVI